MANTCEITTKVAVLHRPRELKFETWKLPSLKPGHVLIKVTSANICPTDVRKYWGYTTLPVPAVLGHEGAGIVERVIDKDLDIQEGDKVWIRPIIYWCGLCKYCKREAINLCEKMVALGFAGGSVEVGIKLQQEGILGLFSEYTIIPKHALIKLPKSLSLEEATFIDPLSCIVKAMEDSKLSKHDQVVVIGCGPMGLLAIQTAKIKGAEKIIAIEPIEERRILASQFGADYTINPDEEDVVSKIIELTDYGADVVIVTTGGSSQAKNVDLAIKMAAKGGRINIFAGAYPSQNISIDPNLIHYKELVITGTFGYTVRHNYIALELIEKRNINVLGIRRPVLPFEELEYGFKIYGKPPALKVGLTIT